MAQPFLAPVVPPLGVHPAFSPPQQTTLIMKEKVFSLSQDNFSITDINSVPVLSCHGTVFSMSGRKTFSGVDGMPLFDLRHRLWSIPRKFYGEAEGGREIFEVRKRWSFGKSKLTASFVNASTGQPIELLVQGDWFDRSATITIQDTDIVVAQISRQFMNARQLLGGMQTYYVTVAPNVDLALIAAICVCLDEVEEQRKQS